MTVTSEKNEKVAQMTFASVFPHYITKVEKKGRTIEELYQIIEWLTGYSPAALKQHIDNKSSFAEFFASATLHPNAELIKGVICGYRIEKIPNEFEVYKQVRYLDKLVDELAKGKKLEKIMRT